MGLPENLAIFITQMESSMLKMMVKRICNLIFIDALCVYLWYPSSTVQCQWPPSSYRPKSSYLLVFQLERNINGEHKEYCEKYVYINYFLVHQFLCDSVVVE